jgi:hypothetical protein
MARSRPRPLFGSGRGADSAARRRYSLVVQAHPSRFGFNDQCLPRLPFSRSSQTSQDTAPKLPSRRITLAMDSRTTQTRLVSIFQRWGFVWAARGWFPTEPTSSSCGSPRVSASRRPLAPTSESSGQRLDLLEDSLPKSSAAVSCQIRAAGGSGSAIRVTCTRPSPGPRQRETRLPTLRPGPERRVCY